MLEIRHRALHDGQSIQDAYDDLFQTRNLLMRDSFYLWLIELLGPPPGSTLLDVACGNGRLVELAAEQGIRAMGVDLSFEGLLHGSADASPAQWIVGDGQIIPFPAGSVDFVMSIGSLEHYDNPLQGVREIARVLKPHGRACILLPNMFGLMGNIRYVRRTGEVFDDEQPRQRYATRATWQTMLEMGGLLIDEVVPWGEVTRPRTTRDWIWSALRPQKALRGAVAAITPLNLANHFIFLARPGRVSTAPVYYPMLSWS
ncbi:MAG: class I SAM-dependent methyltransferase [Caldilineaceae bacterium]|nr:class I SAM-dependent methyltransferase [Caldilineaceae bacterium]